MNIIYKITMIVLVLVIGTGSALNILKFGDYTLDNQSTSTFNEDIDFSVFDKIVSDREVQKETSIQIDKFALHNEQKFVEIEEFIELSGVTKQDNVLEYEGFTCSLEIEKKLWAMTNIIL